MTLAATTRMNSAAAGLRGCRSGIQNARQAETPAATLRTMTTQGENSNWRYNPQNRPLTPTVTVTKLRMMSCVRFGKPEYNCCGSLKRFATSQVKVSDGRSWYATPRFTVFRSKRYRFSAGLVEEYVAMC